MTGDRRRATVGLGQPNGCHTIRDGRRSAVFRLLLITVGNSASRQVVGRHLNTYAVADQDANPVFAHLAGNRCQYDVLGIVELNFKEGVGLLVNDSALRRNQIVSCQ